LRFGTLPLDCAEGAVLAHSLKRPGVAFRKGRRLSAEDIAALRQAGVSDIVAAQFDDGRLDAAEFHGQFMQGVLFDQVGAHT
jgi:molybdenum cofactor cytidylyltransferase